MRTARNIAIIMILAVPVAFIPAGGQVADGIISALQIAFLATLGMLGLQLYRNSSLTLLAMSDAQRGLFYGAIGFLCLMIVAGGSLIWLGLAVAAGAAIFWVWSQSQQSY